MITPKAEQILLEALEKAVVLSIAQLISKSDFERDIDTQYHTEITFYNVPELKCNSCEMVLTQLFHYWERDIHWIRGSYVWTAMENVIAKIKSQTDDGFDINRLWPSTTILAFQMSYPELKEQLAPCYVGASYIEDRKREQQ